MCRRATHNLLAIAAACALSSFAALAQVPIQLVQEAANELISAVVDYSVANPDAPGSRAGWKDAVAGAPLLVHGYSDQDGSYYLTPIKGADGQIVAVVSIGAEDGEWLWYSAIEPREALFLVDATRAASILLDGYGVNVPADSMRLVMAPNKELLWYGNITSVDGQHGFFVSTTDPAEIHTERTFSDAGLMRQPDPSRRYNRARSRESSEQDNDSAEKIFYPPAYEITSVPYHNQITPYHSGPGALEMVFDYWGPDVDQVDIGSAAYTRPEIWGTYKDDLRRASHFSYLNTAIRDTSLEGYDERRLGYGSLENNWSDSSEYPDRFNDLKELISSDYPVLIHTWYDGFHVSGHYRVLKGYNDDLDIFIVHDPWLLDGPDVNYNQEFLVDDLWTYSDRWGLFSAPWMLRPSAPPIVNCCEQFLVTLNVEYLGPHPFEDQDDVTDREASITLPPDFTFAEGEEATKPIPGLVASGSSDTLSWLVIAPNQATNQAVTVEAKGLVYDFSGSYGTYRDYIGGLGAIEIQAVNSDSDCDTYPDDIDCDINNPWCATDCTDTDGDGYCVPHDCDDADPSIHPGAEEFCGNGIDEDCDGEDAACPLVSGVVEVGHEWQSVFLTDQFVDPVVIVGPPSYNDYDPGVVRIDNVAGTSFDVRFEEWAYLDGSHSHMESVSYLVMGARRYVLDDGSIWEAGTFTLSGTGSFSPQSFAEPFAGTPALFLTVQTADDWQPVSVRARNVTSSGFEAAMFEEESLMSSGHGPEEIGYLAIYSVQGSGAVTVDGVPKPYLLQEPAVDERFTPVLSWTLMLEEEESRDSEIGHRDETVSVLALGQHLFAQSVTTDGWDTVALRRLDPESSVAMEWGVVDGVSHSWTTIPLAKSYLNPVVILKPVSNRGYQPGVLRARNLGSGSLDVSYQEWEYLDGSHIEEQVFYLVAEVGQHDLGGLTVEAGKVNISSGGWQSVAFLASFSDPACFSSVDSTLGWDPVIARMRNCGMTGFDLRLQEEQGGDGYHTGETIGWIAIERGSGVTGDGRTIEVLTESIGSVMQAVGFSGAFARRFPIVAASDATTNGWDPFVVRYGSITPTGIDLYLQEEQSGDKETDHVMEDASIFVAE